MSFRTMREQWHVLGWHQRLQLRLSARLVVMVLVAMGLVTMVAVVLELAFIHERNTQ